MHKKTQWGLAAICVLTVVFGWRLATQVPVYAKPLEVYHSEMVDALKTLKALPPIKPHVILQEYHQPPLYYGVTALLSAFDPPIQNRPAQALNPHYLATLIGNRNQYLPDQPGAPTVYVGRLVSMALVLVTVVMTYMQAQVFLPASLAFLA